MSSALLRKSLLLVDPDSSDKKDKSKKQKKATDLIPENYRLIKKVQQVGKKASKKELLRSDRKLTVAEAKKQFKSKEEILKANLKKLKEIREACKFDLDEETYEHIIERALTKRPIKKKTKKAKNEPTAFTEADFEKFESEYFGDE